MLSIIEGIGIAHEINTGFIEEQVQRSGGRKVVPAAIQTLSLFGALELAEKITPLSLPFKCAVLTLPALAAFLSKNRYAQFLHDRLNSMASAAVCISAIALVILGKSALGCAILVMVAIGALSRSRFLPYPLRSLYDKHAFLFAQIPAFILGNLAKKAQAVTEIALNMWGEKCETKHIPAIPRTPLTLDEVEVSPVHLIEELEEAEEGDPLTEQFTRVNWPRYRNKLVDYLSRSSEWQVYAERHFVPSDENLVKEGLLRIERRELNGSEPKSYDKLYNKLDHIRNFLMSASEAKRAEILMRLGVSAYGFSGVVIWEVDEIYAEIITSGDELDYALQKYRDALFEKVMRYYFTPKTAYPILNNNWLYPVERIMYDFFDPDDKHNYYLYVNILAPGFKLTHTHGAETDQLAMSEMTVELVLRCWNARAVLEIAGGYNKQEIYKIAKAKLPHEADLIAHLVNRGIFNIQESQSCKDAKRNF